MNTFTSKYCAIIWFGGIVLWDTLTYEKKNSVNIPPYIGVHNNIYFINTYNIRMCYVGLCIWVYIYKFYTIYEATLCTNIHTYVYVSVRTISIICAYLLWRQHQHQQRYHLFLYISLHFIPFLFLFLVLLFFLPMKWVVLDKNIW